MTQVPSAPLVVEPSKPSPTTVIVTPLIGVLVPSMRFSSRPLTCSPSAAAGWAKENSAISATKTAPKAAMMRRCTPGAPPVSLPCPSAQAEMAVLTCVSARSITTFWTYPWRYSVTTASPLVTVP